jgi:hypothetical protein
MLSGSPASPTANPLDLTLPVLSISPTTVTTGVSGLPSQADFTVHLSAPASQAVTVDYSTYDGTAVAGVDYTAISPTTLTFAPGQIEQTVAVTVAQAFYPSVSDFFVDLFNPSGATIRVGQASCTIVSTSTLNVSNGPTFSAGSATVIADARLPTVATISISLSTPLDQPATVTYATTDRTATAGVDYTAIPPTTLAFAPGQIEQTVAVTIAPEPYGAPKKSFGLVLSNPIGATATVGGGVTILDPATLPELVISPAAFFVPTSGSSPMDFTVNLSASYPQPVTVTCATSDDTATAGVDYVAIPPTTLTFAPGQTTQTVAVTVGPEPAGAAAKSFTVTLSNPSNTDIIQAQASGLIFSSVPEPVITIDSLGVITSSDVPVTVDLPVHLSSASPRPVTVTYTTVGYGGTTPGDEMLPPATLTFAPGQVDQTIPVTVGPDPGGVSTEGLVVNLSDPVGATIAVAAGAGEVSIFPPSTEGPEVSISPTAISAPGPTEALFSVQLSNPTAHAVTVVYTTEDGTARAGVDYTAVPPTTLVFAPGQVEQMIAVPLDETPDDTQAKAFTVTLTQVSGGGPSAHDQATGTIVPPGALPEIVVDPIPLPRLFPHQTSAAESVPRTLQFQIRLSAASATPVSVDYATVDGTARAGIDYAAIPPTTITFAPGQVEQTIAVMAYASVNGKTLAIALSNPIGATVALRQVSELFEQTILLVAEPDLNGPPQVTMDNASDIADPAGPTYAVVTVALSKPFDDTVVVDYATADGTAVAGVDYVPIDPTPLVFAPGQVEQSFVVEVRPEPPLAAPREFTARITAATNGIVENTRATVTILTANLLPKVSIADGAVAASASTPTMLAFTVSLSAPSVVPTTVSYTTADGTAIGGVDYVMTSGTLRFAPGETQKTITVTVNAEPPGGPPKIFSVVLSNANNALIASGRGTGTVYAASLPIPRFTVALLVYSGKGKRRRISCDELFFSAPLDVGSAQNRKNYHVKQTLGRKRTTNVPVLAAMYSSSSNSVSLTFGKHQMGKPLRLTVRGLLGAGGGTVGAFSTRL